MIICRKDPVHFHAISEVTDYLVSAAQEYNEEYDGWETKVIKEKDGFQQRLKEIFKLKEELSQTYSKDKHTYADKKTDFVNSILKRLGLDIE